MARPGAGTAKEERAVTDEKEHHPLGGIRRRIDRVDESLLGLLAERMNLVREIGVAKQSGRCIPVFDPDREREVARRWSESAQRHGLSGAFAERLLRELLEHSRRSQAVLDRGAGYRRWMRHIGYQGEPGAHSELALERLFDTVEDEWRATGFEAFAPLLDALERGDVDGVLVPVENSISGAIPEVAALLADRDLAVLDEELLPVRHCLAAPGGVAQSELREALSHPVALAQCRRRLGALGLRPTPWPDTAGAAYTVARDGGRTRAAVCSPRAAQRAGLAILQWDIADHATNVTRFLLLARGGDPRAETAWQPGVAFKTTVVFSVSHEPGALASCLAILARYGLNLCRIESRVRAGDPWRYAFFVDFEGHAEEAAARRALAELAREAQSLRVLGSYPDRVRSGQA